ncbi:MAG: nuclear transport factor 2 family protein, partial [Vulcanimicrobiaceae bacterium]
FAADGRFVETGGATIAGRAALAAHFARFLGGRPWRIEIERTIVGGEEAALAYRFATEGRDGTWHERAGCALVTARDGTIAEWREYAG